MWCFSLAHGVPAKEECGPFWVVFRQAPGLFLALLNLPISGKLVGLCKAPERQSLNCLQRRPNYHAAQKCMQLKASEKIKVWDVLMLTLNCLYMLSLLSYSCNTEIKKKP